MSSSTLIQEESSVALPKTDKSPHEAKENRELLNVETTKLLVVAINLALEKSSLQELYSAIKKFISHLENTLGKKYKDGLVIATKKNIRDLNIGDIQELLHAALGNDFKDIKVANPLFYLQFQEAIDNIRQSPMSLLDDIQTKREQKLDLSPEQLHFERIFTELTKIANGLRTFAHLLNNRGFPEDIRIFYSEKDYDQAVQKIQSDINRLLNPSPANLHKKSFTAKISLALIHVATLFRKKSDISPEQKLDLAVLSFIGDGKRFKKENINIGFLAVVFKINIPQKKLIRNPEPYEKGNFDLKIAALEMILLEILSQHYKLSADELNDSTITQSTWDKVIIELPDEVEQFFKGICKILSAVYHESPANESKEISQKTFLKLLTKRISEHTDQSQHEEYVSMLTKAGLA